MRRTACRKCATRPRSPEPLTARALAALLLLAAAAAAQDYSAWAHSKDIFFDTSPDGANTASDVVGFPVLVRLTPADLPFGQVKDSGADLRFSKPDGTPLPYEIDRWDRTAGKAEIWVRLDTVKAASRGLLMRMHWGNPAAAAAGSPSATFAAADGFSSVWHLRGVFPSPRANSVGGGMEAVPRGYDNDEQREGVIGWADSLDGANDHLQTWEPFDNLADGFTYSVWAYPTAASNWSRLMDFGNGAGVDNLTLSRMGTSNDLVFSTYSGTTRASVVAPGAIALNQWQHFAVTVSGRTARLYRNGSLVASEDLPHGVTGVRRANNYLGNSNRSGDAAFAGKLDEPVVARAARSADWIRLAWANQKADQSLLSFTAPVMCEARFEVPTGLSATEGGLLALQGLADCADQFQWSVDLGPIARLVDPNVKVLELPVPRISGDTAVVFRFSARYGDSVRTGSVRVTLVDAIPDPQFTLPAEIDWNGKDSLWLRPAIQNLAAIEASPQPDLHFSWRVDGSAVDTAWGAEGLLLKAADSQSPFAVELCLHNNGARICRETMVKMGGSTRLGPGRVPRTAERPAGPGYTADGRRVAGAAVPGTRAPRFRRLIEVVR